MISRRIFAALFLLCAGFPAHAQKTKATLNSEINQSFPDNNVGAITPQILRGVTSDVVNSIMPTAPVVSGNLASYDGTTGLLKDSGFSPTSIIGALCASPTIGSFLYYTGTAWICLKTGIITPEAYGGGTGAADNGLAINAANAASSNPATMFFGCGTYLIVTPALITRQGWLVQGSGPCTVLQFAPISDGTMLTFQRGSSNLAESGIRNLQFFTSDTTFTKGAITVIDVSSFEAANLVFSGVGGSGSMWSGGTGSTCLRTNGRDTSTFHDIRGTCEKPIVIGINPNVANIHADHFHFYNINLVAGTAFASVFVSSGVNLTNFTMDGYEAWVQGDAGFNFVDSASASNSYNVRLANVRCEQTNSGSGYCFNIQVNSSQRLTGLSLENFQCDTGMNCIQLRHVQNASFWGNYFPTGSGGAGTLAYNIDNTNDQIQNLGSLWGTNATVSVTSLTTASSFFQTTGTFSTTVPYLAYYTLSNSQDPFRFAGVTLTGGLLQTFEIAAPATPSAGVVNVWADSTDARLHDKNPAGVIATTAVPQTCTAGQQVTALASTGVLTCAQPSNQTVTGYILVTPVAVNSLPSCTSGLDGAKAFVNNNATGTAFGGAVTTGGSNHHPVYCDGSATAWKQG